MGKPASSSEHLYFFNPMNKLWFHTLGYINKIQNMQTTIRLAIFIRVINFYMPEVFTVKLQWLEHI